MWETLKPRSAALAVLSASAVLAAGCGGGAAGGEGDPATAAPAGAVFYTELVVRPEGSLRDDALDAAGKVLLTDDPEAEIRRLMTLALEDSGEDFDYDRDLEPWLGERAGFWFRPTEREPELGALLLAATDTEKAQASIESLLKRHGKTVTERSYRGADYVVDPGDVAAGIVGDFVAIGPEDAFKLAVDASEGDSLAETDEYTDAIDPLEDDRLAHFWADLPGLLELVRAQDPEARAQLDRLSALVPLDQLPPIAGSFVADGDHLAIEVQLRGAEGAGLGPLLAGGSTPLLQELPGDSWAAMGSADVGESVRTTIDGFAGALGGLVARREVQRQTGLDLDRDLLDWIGDVGFFVRGSTPSTLDGGIVIQPTDEAAAAAALGKLVGAAQVRAKVEAEPIDVPGADQAFELTAPRAPFPIVVARGSGLVVITAGRPAAVAALGSDDRLGGTDLYSEVEELVGMEPGALLSMPELIGLVSAYGHDAELREARPYLEAYSVVAAGMTADDDEATGRVAAGLK